MENLAPTILPIIMAILALGMYVLNLRSIGQKADELAMRTLERTMAQRLTTKEEELARQGRELQALRQQQDTAQLAWMAAIEASRAETRECHEERNKLQQKVIELMIQLRNFTDTKEGGGHEAAAR